MALYTIKEEEATLHISKGNSKLGKGIYSFATLPGNKDHMLYVQDKGLLTDIPGTCSKFCENCAKDGACYAWRDAKLHHNVTIRAWAENTLLLRNGSVFKLIDEYITSKNKKVQQIYKFRINTSGEIQSSNELVSWNELAHSHPEVTFGIYTKNYEALEDFVKFLNTFGLKAADNLVINVSEWHGVAKEFLKNHPGEFNVFEYDDSLTKSCTLDEEEKQRLAKEMHCPAVTANGHHAKDANGNDITCDQCGRCYRKTGKVTAVYAH